ncbi:unnamed protein product [Rhizoctonia solani]|uniref:Uncharacterized protein n=1 Tax=Rhizoctonia solani TaxID=456999 RepID=A0A8H3GRQ9_9AGAM|nr:unnamed protein product [Rhizoctonia solani]
MSAPTLTYPPLHKDAKFVILSDWDGTITNFDSNDYLTDNVGYGYEKRRASNKEVLAGNKTFRDSFREMLESVHLPLDECKEILKKNIKLDTGFKDFFEWCKANDVPFIIVSRYESINRSVPLPHGLYSHFCIVSRHAARYPGSL